MQGCITIEVLVTKNWMVTQIGIFGFSLFTMLWPLFGMKVLALQDCQIFHLWIRADDRIIMTVELV